MPTATPDPASLIEVKNNTSYYQRLWTGSGEEYEYFVVVGEVENISPHPLTGLWVVATYYGSDGEEIGSGSGAVSLGSWGTTLNAGERAPFIISSVPLEIRPASYELHIEPGLRPSRERNRDLTIVTSQGEIVQEPQAYYTVTGEVENSGDHSREHVMVTATFRDENGHVVGVDSVWLYTLEPGDSRPFTVSTLPHIPERDAKESEEVEPFVGSTVTRPLVPASHDLIVYSTVPLDVQELEFGAGS